MNYNPSKENVHGYEIKQSVVFEKESTEQSARDTPARPAPI